MKILIFYACYGGGHIGAAKSINECLKNSFGENDIELIDCMKYINKAVEKITTSLYSEFAKRAPWLWGKIYNNSQKGFFSYVSTWANKLMSKKLHKLLLEKSPDLIISTHPFSSQMCSYLKGQGKTNSRIATVMTDFAPHDQWLLYHENTEFFFVANDKMKESLENKGIDKNKIFVTGIPLSSRFSQTYDRKEILNSFSLEDNKKTLLFFGGGEFGLGKAMTYTIFESIIKNFDNIQIVAIAGKNEKMKIKFEEIVKNNNAEKRVTVLSFTNQVPELMSISDLVVSKPGGMTTTESLACNLPMIIINPIPGQEEENAEFLESKGVAIWVKNENEVYPKLDELLSNPDKFNEMKKNTTKIGNKNSTKNICETILNTIKK